MPSVGERVRPDRQGRVVKGVEFRRIDFQGQLSMADGAAKLLVEVFDELTLAAKTLREKATAMERADSAFQVKPFNELAWKSPSLLEGCWRYDVRLVR